MISSLQSQLKKLHSSESSYKPPVRDSEVVSVLFNPSVAAKISKDQVHLLAQSAFVELIAIDPLLSEFEAVIREPPSDRSLLTDQENNALRKKLKKLLRLLSVNLLNPNTMKVLELLYRSHKVYAFEPNAVFLSFVLYHSTSSFHKLLQFLPKDKSYSNMVTAAQKQQEIKRKMLIDLFAKDLGLFTQLLKLITKFYTDLHDATNGEEQSFSANGQFLFSLKTGQTMRGRWASFAGVLLTEMIETVPIGKGNSFLAAVNYFIGSAFATRSKPLLLASCVCLVALSRRGLLTSQARQRTVENLLEIVRDSEDEKLSLNILKTVQVIMVAKNNKLEQPLSLSALSLFCEEKVIDLVQKQSIGSPLPLLLSLLNWAEQLSKIQKEESIKTGFGRLIQTCLDQVLNAPGGIIIHSRARHLLEKVIEKTQHRMSSGLSSKGLKAVRDSEVSQIFSKFQKNSAFGEDSHSIDQEYIGVLVKTGQTPKVGDIEKTLEAFLEFLSTLTTIESPLVAPTIGLLSHFLHNTPPRSKEAKGLARESLESLASLAVNLEDLEEESAAELVSLLLEFGVLVSTPNKHSLISLCANNNQKWEKKSSNAELLARLIDQLLEKNKGVVPQAIVKRMTGKFCWILFTEAFRRLRKQEDFAKIISKSVPRKNIVLMLEEAASCDLGLNAEERKTPSQKSQNEERLRRMRSFYKFISLGDEVQGVGVIEQIESQPVLAILTDACLMEELLNARTGRNTKIIGIILEKSLKAEQTPMRAFLLAHHGKELLGNQATGSKMAKVSMKKEKEILQKPENEILEEINQKTGFKKAKKMGNPAEQRSSLSYLFIRPFIRLVFSLSLESKEAFLNEKCQGKHGTFSDLLICDLLELALSTKEEKNIEVALGLLSKSTRSHPEASKELLLLGASLPSNSLKTKFMGAFLPFLSEQEEENEQEEKSDSENEENPKKPKGLQVDYQLLLGVLNDTPLEIIVSLVRSSPGAYLFFFDVLLTKLEGISSSEGMKTRKISALLSFLGFVSEILSTCKEKLFSNGKMASKFSSKAILTVKAISEEISQAPLEHQWKLEDSQSVSSLVHVLMEICTDPTDMIRLSAVLFNMSSVLSHSFFGHLKVLESKVNKDDRLKKQEKTHILIVISQRLSQFGFNPKNTIEAALQVFHKILILGQSSSDEDERKLKDNEHFQRVFDSRELEKVVCEKWLGAQLILMNGVLGEKRSQDIFSGFVQKLKESPVYPNSEQLSRVLLACKHILLIVKEVLGRSQQITKGKVLKIMKSGLLGHRLLVAIQKTGVLNEKKIVLGLLSLAKRTLELNQINSIVKGSLAELGFGSELFKFEKSGKEFAELISILAELKCSLEKYLKKKENPLRKKALLVGSVFDILFGAAPFEYYFWHAEKLISEMKPATKVFIIKHFIHSFNGAVLMPKKLFPVVLSFFQTLLFPNLDSENSDAVFGRNSHLKRKKSLTHERTGGSKDSKGGSGSNDKVRKYSLVLMSQMSETKPGLAKFLVKSIPPSVIFEQFLSSENPSAAGVQCLAIVLFGIFWSQNILSHEIEILMAIFDRILLLLAVFFKKSNPELSEKVASQFQEDDVFYLLKLTEKPEDSEFHPPTKSDIDLLWLGLSKFHAANVTDVFPTKSPGVLAILLVSGAPLSVVELFVQEESQAFLTVFEAMRFLSQQEGTIKHLVTLYELFLKALKKVSTGSFALRSGLIFKVIQNGLVFSEHEGADEATSEKIERLTLACWKEFCLKCNENQLKGYFVVLLKWAKLEDLSESAPDKRSLLIFRLAFEASESLGEFFTKFHAYLFDHYIMVLKEHARKDSGISKLKKRTSQEQLSPESIETMATWALRNLRSLIVNDSSKSFIDSLRFDKLVNPLSEQLAASHTPQFDAFLNAEVFPTMIAMFDILGDETKCRVLHSKILSQTRNKNPSIRCAALTLVTKIIENQKEAYMNLMNDLFPYLVDVLDDEDTGVEAKAKEVLHILEAVTGQDIKEELLSSRLK